MRTKTLAFSALLSIAITLTGVDAQAQQSRDFGSGDTIHILSDVKLKRKQRAHFRQFKSNTGYFSYFYLAPNEDHSVFFANMNNLENAKWITEQLCMELSKSKAPCIPYAVSLPKSVPANTTRAAGFGEEARKTLTGKFVRQAKRQKGWAAFALNGGTNFGWSTGRKTKQDAIESALGFCSSATHRVLANAPSRTRAMVEQSGVYKCTVAHVAEYR